MTAPEPPAGRDGGVCIGAAAASAGLSLPAAVTPRQPLLQIEFYFSDSNLPRDKFLSERVAADPEGYVDIALLCIFQVCWRLLRASCCRQP